MTWLVIKLLVIFIACCYAIHVRIRIATGIPPSDFSLVAALIFLFLALASIISFMI